MTTTKLENRRTFFIRVIGTKLFTYALGRCGDLSSFVNVAVGIEWQTDLPERGPRPVQISGANIGLQFPSRFAHNGASCCYGRPIG